MIHLDFRRTKVLFPIPNLPFITLRSLLLFNLFDFLLLQKLPYLIIAQAVVTSAPYTRQKAKPILMIPLASLLFDKILN